MKLKELREKQGLEVGDRVICTASNDPGVYQKGDIAVVVKLNPVRIRNESRNTKKEELKGLLGEWKIHNKRILKLEEML